MSTLSLEVKNITKRFGGLIAVNNFSLSIVQKEIVGLIGPNGAGKTTLFNCITKLVKPDSGILKLYGENIISLKPHQIARKGIARTFQTPRIFERMTVIENVIVGCINIGCTGKCAYEKAEYFLEYVKLKEKMNITASELNMQERRLLEIARALALNPKVILFDEVAAGLNPSEITEIRKLILRIREEYNVAILWVEHIMEAIMKSADRVVVMNNGEKIAEGLPKEVSRDENVIKAYLGEEYKEV